MLLRSIFIAVIIQQLFATCLRAQICVNPGQVPSTALPVCGVTKFTQSTVPICKGISGLPGMNCNFLCDIDGINPFWYKFTCFKAGTLGFIISPQDLTDDYDWAFYDVTNKNPDDIFRDPALIVCYNWSGEIGQTGAAPSGTGQLNCCGYNIPTFNAMPVLQKDHNYLLLISHFTPSQSGYQLSFEGGTALITDPDLPRLQSVGTGCSSSEVNLKLNKVIRCNSIALNGSDFTLVSSTTVITGSKGINCSGNFDTDSVNIQFSTPLPPGKYTLKVKQGSDGNSLLDFCDNAVSDTDQLQFEVTRLIAVTLEDSACEGQPYILPSGRAVINSGVYNDTLKNVLGCDSVINIIKLTVFSPVRKTIDTTICEGLAYLLPSGILKNEAGVYYDTLRNVAGCDSLITTLNLAVAGVTRKTIDTSICTGAIFTLPSGITKNVAGVYNDTARNHQGCDSLLLTVNLTFYSAALKHDTSALICEGQQYTLPTGITKNTTGTYTDTLRNKQGCDSLITLLHLSVFSPARTTVDTSICQGLTYILPSGIAKNETGIYYDTLRNVLGCDSLITTLNLKIFEVIRRAIDASICLGGSYTLPSGLITNIPGVYIDTASNTAGCDSLILTINLKVNTATSSNVTASICLGQSYTLPSGQMVNTPGLYVSTVKNNNGCDSLVSTTLTYYPPLSVTVTGPATLCSGEQALITAQASGGNGGPYNYSWSTSSATTNPLIIFPVSDTKEMVSISDGCTILAAKDSISIKVNPTPVPAFSVAPENGCVPLLVNFVNSTSPSLNNIYYWAFGDQGFSPEISPSHNYIYPGSYTVSLAVITPDGCSDSVKALHLVKAYTKPVAAFKTAPFPNTMANSKIDFTNASVRATSWLWIFGDGIGSSVQRDPTYIYQDAGTYTAMLVAATGNNCTDTSYAIIDIRGGKDIYIPNAFTPNGDGINDHFRVYGIGLQSVEMVIFDKWGKKVFQQKGNPPVWDGKYKKYGKECDQGAYLYVIKAIDKNGKEHSFNGTVILLR